MQNISGNSDKDQSARRKSLALAVNRRIKFLRLRLVTPRSDPVMSSRSLYRSDQSFEADGASDWPPEIAFLGPEGMAPATLAYAAQRARDQGVGADEVLIAEA
jgi:hypothetical protein